MKDEREIGKVRVRIERGKKVRRGNRGRGRDREMG